MQTEPSPFSSRFYLSDLLHLARRYWLLLFLVPAAIFVFLVLLAVFGSRYYVASASVYMDPSFGHRIQTESTGREPQVMEDEEALFSMEETICSGPMVLRVLKKLNLSEDQDYLPKSIRKRKAAGLDVSDSRLVDAVQARYDAELVNATRILKVYARDTSPERASRIAKTFINEFVLFLHQQRVESEADLKVTLLKQAEEVRKRAIKAEQDLNQFRTQQPDFLVEQDSDLFTQQMQDAGSELRKTNSELIRLKSLIDSLDHVDATENPMRIFTLSKGEYAVDLESVIAQRSAAQIRLEDVKQRYGSNHTEYRAAHNQFVSIDESLKRHAQEIKDSTQSRFEQQTQQKEVLESEMKSLRERFNTYKSASAEFRGLAANVEREWEVYDRINDRILNLSDSAELSPNLATPLGEPIVPFKASRKDLISAAAAGVVLSVGWIVVVGAILVFRGLPFTNNRQIQDVLGVPLVATVAEGDKSDPGGLAALPMLTDSKRVVYLTSADAQNGSPDVCRLVADTYLSRGEQITILRISDPPFDGGYSFGIPGVETLDLSSSQVEVKEMKRRIKQFLKENPTQNVVIDSTAVKDSETKLALGKITNSAVVIVNENGITREQAEKWFQRLKLQVPNVLALYQSRPTSHHDFRFALPMESSSKMTQVTAVQGG